MTTQTIVRTKQITLAGIDDPGDDVFFIKNNSIFARERGRNYISSYKGSRNSIYGKNAGENLKNANDNVMMGYKAGYGTNVNSSITAFGSDNTFIGSYAGHDNISGYRNVYIGAKNSYNTSNTINSKENVSIGYKSSASGNNSISIGVNNTVTSNNSSSFGDNNINTGSYSHVYGNNITNNGSNCLLIIPNSSNQTTRFINNNDNYVNIYNLFHGIMNSNINVTQPLTFESNVHYKSDIIQDGILYTSNVITSELSASNVNVNNIVVDNSAIFNSNLTASNVIVDNIIVDNSAIFNSNLEVNGINIIDQLTIINEQIESLYSLSNISNIHNPPYFEPINGNGCIPSNIIEIAQSNLIDYTELEHGLVVPGAMLTKNENVFQKPTYMLEQVYIGGTCNMCVNPNTHFKNSVQIDKTLTTSNISSHEYKIKSYDDNGYWRIYTEKVDDTLYDLIFRSSNNAAASFTDFFDPTLFNFTGQHRCTSYSIPHNELGKNDLIGKIVCSTGKYNDLDGNPIYNVNDAIPIVELSSNAYDKRCFGVVSDIECDDEQRHFQIGNMKFTNVKNKENRKFIINSVGEGGIWICNQNGNFENGDYITSSDIIGYGMKQNTDSIGNYTVAKITCDCNFDLDSRIYNCTEMKTNNEIYKTAFVGCTYKC